MNSVYEQYQIQFKETQKYWHRKRRKRALIYLILTIAIVITTFILRNDEYFVLLKYPLIIMAIISAVCVIRELIVPLRNERRELKRLEHIYDEERFRERKG